MQKTSWEGTLTRQLQRQGKAKGAYTRYHNRVTRQGLEVIRNKKYYNEVYSIDGELIGIEPKYRNLSTNDHQAKIIYEKMIKKGIPRNLAKAGLKEIIR